MTKSDMKYIINEISKILVHAITLFVILVFIDTVLANNKMADLLSILTMHRKLWLPIINSLFIIAIILFILEIKNLVKSKNKNFKWLIIYITELFIIYSFSISVGFCYCATID